MILTKDYIAEDDLKIWDLESSRTFTRKTSSGGTQTVYKHSPAGITKNITTLASEPHSLKKCVIVLGRSTPGDGGGGRFYWDSSNLKTECDADPQHGKYLPAAGDDGTNGAWVRDIVLFVVPQWFGAKADDSTDCSTSLQAAIDFAYDNQLALYIPGGTYKITTPLAVYGTNDEESDYQTVIYGDGWRKTNIKKYGNTTISDGGVGNPDCVVIIYNDFVRGGGTISDYYDGSETASYYVNISDLQLSFDGDYTSGSRVEFGIYSTGVFFGKFKNIWLNDFEKAFETNVWNCYSRYEGFRIDHPSYGFNFVSDIIGNTTMDIVDCHFNGPETVAMKLKGSGTIQNCPVDGGDAVHYHLIGGTFTILSPHSESPDAAGLIYADAADVSVCGATFEIPLVAGAICFELVNGSTVIVNDSDLHVTDRTGDGYPATAPGSLYSVEDSSNLIFNFTSVSEEFDTVQNYSVSSNEKKYFISKNWLSAHYNEYMAYVSGAISPANYPVLTVSEDGATNRLDIESLGTAGNGTWAIMFTDPINLDAYSRLKMVATLSNTLGSGAYTIRFGLSRMMLANGQIETGVSIPSDADTYGYDEYWYDDTDHDFYIDTTDLYGDYYVYVWLPANTPDACTLEIKEISAIK